MIMARIQTTKGIINCVETLEVVFEMIHESLTTNTLFFPVTINCSIEYYEGDISKTRWEMQPQFLNANHIVSVL